MSEQSPSGQSVQESIAEFTQFPLVVESVRERAVGGPQPGTSHGRKVEAAISEALGWRIRDKDPKGFLAALTHAFTPREVEGHREWIWNPRSVNVQADLGAVTGAQASIAARARAAVDDVLPLVDGLTPLQSAGDQEKMEASRSIVRRMLTELVRELAQEGGPRVVRVDEIFQSLLGPAPPCTPSAGVGGELHRLGVRFGLEARHVDTVQEEANLTNYIVLVDYVSSLRAGWVAVRSSFDRSAAGSARFFGSQLVLLSRGLAVVSETVQEVYAALDSVFVGEVERETIDIVWPVHQGSEGAVEGAGAGSVDHDPPLSLAEGLRWVEELASVEGPWLLEQAGKQGVSTFRSTLRRLLPFVTAAASDPAAGGRSPRVKRALRDLENVLAEVAKQTEAILPDRHTITGVIPVAGDDRDVATLVISGTNFRRPVQVFLRDADSGGVGVSNRTIIGADSVALVEQTTIIATFHGVVSLTQGTVVVVVDDEEAEFPFPAANTASSAS
jgi:hypothetical protein